MAHRSRPVRRTGAHCGRTRSSGVINMGNKLPILAAALIGLIAGAAIIDAITPVPPSTKAPDSRPAANLPATGPDTGPLPDESGAVVAEITKERDEARDAAETAAAQLET